MHLVFVIYILGTVNKFPCMVVKILLKNSATCSFFFQLRSIRTKVEEARSSLQASHSRLAFQVKLGLMLTKTFTDISLYLRTYMEEKLYFWRGKVFVKYQQKSPEKTAFYFFFGYLNNRIWWYQLHCIVVLPQICSVDSKGAKLNLLKSLCGVKL